MRSAFWFSVGVFVAFCLFWPSQVRAVEPGTYFKPCQPSRSNEVWYVRDNALYGCYDYVAPGPSCTPYIGTFPQGTGVGFSDSAICGNAPSGYVRMRTEQATLEGTCSGSITNSIKDGWEPVQDCGGPCGATAGCPPPQPESCSNGVKDSNELGIDCGSGCTNPCAEMCPEGYDKICELGENTNCSCVKWVDKDTMGNCPAGYGLNGNRTATRCGYETPSTLQYDQMDKPDPPATEPVGWTGNPLNGTSTGTSSTPATSTTTVTPSSTGGGGTPTTTVTITNNTTYQHSGGGTVLLTGPATTQTTANGNGTTTTTITQPVSVTTPNGDGTSTTTSETVTTTVTTNDSTGAVLNSGTSSSNNNLFANGALDVTTTVTTPGAPGPSSSTTTTPISTNPNQVPPNEQPAAEENYGNYNYTVTDTASDGNIPPDQIPEESSLSDFLDDAVSNNPATSIISGSGVETSNPVCSISGVVMGQELSISFCSPLISDALTAMGYILVSICYLLAIFLVFT